LTAEKKAGKSLKSQSIAQGLALFHFLQPRVKLTVDDLELSVSQDSRGQY